ncbi:hypothetical protein [uncultured Desulfobacter sp.]|uniref:hypothetical protein n=1 Tax=uncultured Desulfobacter sp. TaxID=240139 RepID=UPI0029F49E2B|nr:hypothetical protein [uncultured Desulfobacter sp.]
MMGAQYEKTLYNNHCVRHRYGIPKRLVLFLGYGIQACRISFIVGGIDKGQKKADEKYKIRPIKGGLIKISQKPYNSHG